MPLFAHGPVVAPSGVSLAGWLSGLRGRAPLVLAPSSAAGWFGGTPIVACDPVSFDTLPADVRVPYRLTPSLARAGACLDAGIRGECLSVALLGYDGSGAAACYRRGLLLAKGGWRTWGEWGGALLPHPGEAAPLPAGRRLLGAPSSDLDEKAYGSLVRRAAAGIGAGDVYVLNLTRRLRGHALADEAVTFATLSARTEATMGAAWELPGGTVVSASPERFLELRGRLALISPVKGTRARGRTADEDGALLAGLLGCEKERAEHVMVVDLERNDLGRICEPGSVQVSPLMSVETTLYCHQLVSRVGGILAEGIGCADVLAATFPCGSVTGAPKRVAMRFISRLEASARGVYTGSLMVATNGRLDSSVLIRTAVMQGGLLTYGTGCGITIDSDPAFEWRESVLKTSPLTE